MHHYKYVLFNIKSLVETISKQVTQKNYFSKKETFSTHHMLGNNDSNLVLTVMIYQNDKDLPVFLLIALAQGNRCVWRRHLRRLHSEVLQE